MCRLADYFGSRINLASFLLLPPHSLNKQSWASEEMQDATVNADGFGFAWENEEKNIVVYKSILPVWSDNNLAALAETLKSNLCLANVRSATPGQPLGESNTQPFVDRDMVYLHNGFIKPFSISTKAALLDTIDNDLRAEINGNTDSEYLFALIKQGYKKSKDIITSIKEAMQYITNNCGEINAMLNIIIYKDGVLYICRHAFNETCPSLYYSINNDAFPDSIIVASEKLNDSKSWITVSPHTLIQLSLHDNPQLISL